jgi:ketosteroid isomerase-like protein
MADEGRVSVTAEAAMDAFYRATESSDATRLASLLVPDAFVLSPTASGVMTSGEAVVRDLQRWTDGLGARGATLQLRLHDRLVGVGSASRCAWVFDQLVAQDVDGEVRPWSVPIRCTALLVLEGTWRIAAAYWSIPFETQADQNALKQSGDLEPGVELEAAVAPDAIPLAARLQGALQRPELLPGLYSTRSDHVTLGSVVDEVFLGAAGQSAWTEFVEHVSAFELRGAMRGALVAPDVGWLATNIDIGRPPTPYRFFYVWLHEASGWRIVVSHDAVSRDPLRDASIAS